MSTESNAQPNEGIEQNSEDDEESEEDIVGRVAPRMNKFAVAFTNANDGASADSTDSEGIEPTAEAKAGCSKAVDDEMPKRCGKKKKKKRKGKVEDGKTADKDKLWMDELDGIMRKLNTTEASSSALHIQLGESAELETLLKVDVRSLDPDAELRRLLGRTFGGEQQQQRGGRAQQRRQQPWGRLVKSRADWPLPRQLGFYMAEEYNGTIRWFRFRHNEPYQNQQQLFWLYQRQMDHEGILNDILVQNAYHLDSLLLLSEILTVQEDFNRARDSIERGIFACESVFHTAFQPLSPLHRLDYGWRENRAFFLLLHRHMLHQLQRRCFQTALQFGKMIFGKDPEGDPLGLLLIIDVLSLKGRSPNFLLDFYAYYKQKRRLDLLPNFLFSLPLAHLALAATEMNAKAKAEKEHEAEKCLEEAYIRFPFILSQILDQLQVQPDSAVEGNSYLNSMSIYRETSGCRLLAHIYVRHSADELWRPQLSWLEHTTHLILPRLKKRCSEMDEWAQKRKRSFIGLPPNVIRHCILHGIRPSDSALTHLFDENVGRDNVTDPCPPKDTRQDYVPANLDELLNSHGVNATGQNSRQDSVGFLGSFMRSILPEQEQNFMDALLLFAQQRFRERMGNGSTTDEQQRERTENDEEGREGPRENNDRRQEE